MWRCAQYAVPHFRFVDQATQCVSVNRPQWAVGDLCIILLHARLNQLRCKHSDYPPVFTTLPCALSKMATLFESSLSSSMSRQTMAPVGPSVADTLPNINFGFDDLRDRMAKFTAKFDAFIEQGRKRVLEERNQFRMNLAELHGMMHSNQASQRHCTDSLPQRINV